MPPLFTASDKNLLLQHGITALLALAQRRGGKLHKLLSGTKIFEPDLSNPLACCHHQDWLKLISHCQQLQSPELPFLLADSLLNSRTLALSQSLFFARDLAHSMQQLLYFRHQVLPALYPKIQQVDNNLMLVFKPAVALGAQQQFIIVLAISFIIKLIQHQLGNNLGVAVQLQQARPAHLQHFTAHWHCAVRFEQHFDAILIPLSLWHQPFSGRDHAKQRELRQYCRQLKQQLPVKRGPLELLQRLIAKALPSQLGIEDAAAALNLSSSSLKRLLQQHQTNFATLADEVRRDKARLLLLQGNLSNRQLALQLGYSDEHNFRRAFKRWTGMLPSRVKALSH